MSGSVGEVWYAVYGSNLSAERFGCYLQGGRPEGAAREYPGCRDRRPPREDRPLMLPGRLIFGWESPTWGGGIAFYDADPAGPGVYARAYLISGQQFADVAAQEMHRTPTTDLDLVELLASGRHTHGPGRYETLHLVAELDGLPVITFTADDPSSMPPNAPSPAYLATMITGLREAHTLDDDAIEDYLNSCAR